jgi:hypothetical protein
VNTTGSPSPKATSLTNLVEDSAQSLLSLTNHNITTIRGITRRMHSLALNALIEASRAGDHGRGFTVVAQEVRAVSQEIEELTDHLGSHLGDKVSTLQEATSKLAAEATAQRFVDLALNAVELIDRNLYERTCDVRWWATDSAVVDCAMEPTPEAVQYACKRLGVILSSYTVYLDLWLCSLDGRVIANGRPERYPIHGQVVVDEPWFSRGTRLSSGDDYAVADVARCTALHKSQVATYIASVREGGESNGRPIGLLAIHFDWEPQASAIVEGVRLTPEEARRTRVMLVDATGRIIAWTGGTSLEEHFPLETNGRPSGHYINARGHLVAFHSTPGYETYKGLGWYGVIDQAPA